jgi:tRNA uridine 5-carbamoylmethylation protein Kti12
MIIFTAGYPFSGKTEFAKEILKAVGKKRKTLHIDPSTLRPPEYDSMNEGEKTKTRITSWEVAQDMLIASLKTEDNDTIIIFDTCAAKTKTMLQHFVTAKAQKHTIIYAFVGAVMDDCRNRAGDKWPNHKIITGYASDFKESIPELRKASDKFFFIKNNDSDKTDLVNAASRIAKAIIDGQVGRVHKPQLVRRSASRPGQKSNTRRPPRQSRPV